MFLSEYAENLTKGTCTHTVTLGKDGLMFVGIFNGLSHWGRVEDGQGNLVEELNAPWDENDNCLSNFIPNDFEEAGYDIIG